VVYASILMRVGWVWILRMLVSSVVCVLFGVMIFDRLVMVCCLMFS